MTALLVRPGPQLVPDWDRLGPAARQKRLDQLRRDDEQIIDDVAIELVAVHGQAKALTRVERYLAIDVMRARDVSITEQARRLGITPRSLLRLHRRMERPCTCPPSDEANQSQRRCQSTRCTRS